MNRLEARAIGRAFTTRTETGVLGAETGLCRVATARESGGETGAGSQTSRWRTISHAARAGAAKAEILSGEKKRRGAGTGAIAVAGRVVRARICALKLAGTCCF